jgi:hypothetical protein
MPKPRPGSREGNRRQLSLLDSELSDLIDCVTIAADRAESSAYEVAGTPKARRLALARAKRLYALADRLLDIDEASQ